METNKPRDLYGKVSRGNTADLIGRFNKLEVASTSGNLLSPQPGDRFRKTSAFVTSSTLSPESPRPRKTSAMVLMPAKSALKTTSAYDRPTADTLSVSPRPLKKVSLITTPTYSMTNELNLSPRPVKKVSLFTPKTSSFEDHEQLKSEPVEVADKKDGNDSLVTEIRKNTYVISSGINSALSECIPTAEETEKKGSNCSNLGRSKSFKCTRVKYGPSSFEDKALSNRSTEVEKISPFNKFKEIEKNQAQSSANRLTRQGSLPSFNGPVSAPPPVQGVDKTVPTIVRSRTAYGIGQVNQSDQSNAPKSKPMIRSPSSAKELVLAWVQERTNTYPGLNVTNFSTCWNDGLAFCALIHYYYPEAFDFNSLESKNRRYNFTLAFDAAEQYADICPLLEVDDMVRMKKPDWKCVFTYVQSFYRRFRNGRDPPRQQRKTIALDSHTASQMAEKLQEKRIEVRNEDAASNGSVCGSPVSSCTSSSFSFDACPDQPLSPEQKRHLLSKYFIDEGEDQTSMRKPAAVQSFISKNTGSVKPKPAGTPKQTLLLRTTSSPKDIMR